MDKRLEKIIADYREVKQDFADEFISSLIRYNLNDLEEDLTDTIMFVETALDKLRNSREELQELLNEVEP